MKYAPPSSSYTVLKSPDFSDSECPRKLMPIKSGDSFQEIHARLTWDKEGDEKFSYPVGKIHQRLRTTLDQQPTKQGNTLIANISFQVSVRPPRSKKIYFMVDFPLRIPKFNRSKFLKSDKSLADCFSYSDLKAPLKHASIVDLIKSLYCHGRKMMGLEKKCTHGHIPAFDESEEDNKYVRHSEQALVAYLCTKDASDMLLKRLVVELRGEVELPPHSLIKIYSAVLHIHSNKTPCAVCEYTLLGLQNTRLDGALKGMTDYLQETIWAANRAHDNQEAGALYQFSYPGYRKAASIGISMATLYSATEVDGHHRIPLIPTEPVRDTASLPINLRHHQSSDRIFLTNFGKPLSLSETTDSDTFARTTFLSGSSLNAQTSKTKAVIGRMVKKTL